MYNLKMSYQDIQQMPWEYLDWIYKRHIQFLVDREQEMNNQGGIYK